MKVFLIIFNLLLFIIVSGGCGASYEESNFIFGIGKYKFIMNDSAGNKLAEGILNMKIYDSKNEISGSYEFTKIYQKDFPGLSTMNGEFSGNVNKTTKKVFINTNPRIADSNVFWNLEMKKRLLSGEWAYSVFRGTGNKGTIKITK